MLRALLAMVVVGSACGDNLQAIDAPGIDGRAVDAASDAASDAPDSGVAQLAFVQGPIDFGVVGVATTSPPLLLSATNVGAIATGPVSFAFTGSDRFATTSTCAAIAPGATCPVAVTFSPVIPGAVTAELTAGAQPGGAAMVTLGGFGVTIDGIFVSPAVHTFGAVTVGSTASAQTFSVSNEGVATTGALSVALAGTNPGDFTITAQTCDGAQLVGGGAPCTISVAFMPTTTGSRTAMVVVLGMPGGTVTGALSGIGQ